ncbi:MAG: hypothetical protein AABX05_01140 [Nanoarchaeota archaeon]
MAWFKSKEEKQEEREEELAKALQFEKQRTEYKELIMALIITPESIESYQRRMGYTVEVIDTEEQNKGVIFEKNSNGYGLKGSYELKKRLVKACIEAIVEANYSLANIDEHTESFYGLPVRRKDQGPYR